MITQYKKKNLKKLIEGEHNLYNNFNLIGDKLRVFYNSLGWNNMLENFSQVDNLVERLTINVLEQLENGKTRCILTSAGLRVEGCFTEEGFLELYYSFVII